MKSYLHNFLCGLSLLSLVVPGASYAQDKPAEEKPSLQVGVRYFNKDNRLPYFMVNTKAKVDGKFRPIKGRDVRLYMDSVCESNLLGRFTTDEAGNGKAVLPVSVQGAWNAAEKHSFTAVAAGDKEYDEAKGTAEIIKSRIGVDTSSDGETRSISVTVSQFQGGKWVPLPEAEMKIGVARLGGMLQINETETFTTDSTGKVSAEFSRLKLPGDDKGNLVLVAQIEDNDAIGNISAGMTVPWGVPAIHVKNFFHRALWGSRFRSPLWLLFMAYSIIGMVWGVLVYLVFLLFKVRKLGRGSSFPPPAKDGTRGVPLPLS